MTDPGTSSPGSDGDSVEQFLADLRLLRDRQPSVSYETMATRATQRGYKLSRSAMHNVYQARKMPTREAAYAFVVALTDLATAEKFNERWLKLNDETTATDGIGGPAAPPEVGGPDVEDAPGAEPDSKRTRRSWWWLVAFLVVVMVTNTITWLVTIAVVRPSTTETTPSASDIAASSPAAATVRDGMNPNQLPQCLNDVQTVDSTTNESFTVKVNFSEHCNAAWGKVERIDGRGLGNTIEIRIYPAAAPDDDTTAQRTSEKDATKAFTPIIVRTDPTERLCVAGTVTDAARTIPAARPVCL